MKNIAKLFILSFLMMNIVFANTAFKTTFLNKNEGEKKETVFISKKTTAEAESKNENNFIESDAIFQDISFLEESVLRIDEPKENCVVDINGHQNCPTNAVQCDNLIEKSLGEATLNQKSITVNKYLSKDNINYICPKDYYDLDGINSQYGKCKKDYSFYTYSCKNDNLNKYGIGWKGPIVSTGEDCNAQCGPNGCVCNSPVPPEDNCFREHYTCPFDSKIKCTQMKDNELKDKSNYEGYIYDLGKSKKIKKRIYKNKKCSKGFYLSKYNTCTKKPTKMCDFGFILKNNQCVKTENNKVIEKYTAINTCPKNSTYNYKSKKCESTPICTPGYQLKNNKCIKEYSYFKYSCPENYTQKLEGKDCQGICGPNGCSCNSELPPVNNCKIKYDVKNNPDIVQTYKKPIYQIKPEGNFNIEDYNQYHGFSSEENKMENISKIFTSKKNPNQLCFTNNSNETSCINTQKCRFDGYIEEDKIKEINILKNKIVSSDKTQYIKSNCYLNGHIGWKNRTEGITSITTDENRILFWDSFMDKNIGFIEFIPVLEQKDFNDGFLLKDDISYKIQENNSYTIDFFNGYTYFSSEKAMPLEACKQIATKNDVEVELFFEGNELKNFLKVLSGNNYEYINLPQNKYSKCILKKEGNYSFKNTKYIFKTEQKTEGNTVFKCSPLSCVDNQCQKTTCPSGYKGYIHTKNEVIDPSECQDQVCDKNKPYSPYCGKTAECDTSENNIIYENDECKRAVCEYGTFDKEKNKCIQEGCEKGFHLENNFCVKDK